MSLSRQTKGVGRLLFGNLKNDPTSDSASTDRRKRIPKLLRTELNEGCAATEGRRAPFLHDLFASIAILSALAWMARHWLAHLTANKSSVLAFGLLCVGTPPPHRLLDIGDCESRASSSSRSMQPSKFLSNLRITSSVPLRLTSQLHKAHLMSLAHEKPNLRRRTLAEAKSYSETTKGQSTTKDTV